MEAEGSAGPANGSQAAPPPLRVSKRKAPRASKYLANLPSRGLFSAAAAAASNLSGMRVYVCDHDTSPPEDQLIKTDTTEISIRALQLNNQGNESKDVNTKATRKSNRGKRSAVRMLDGRNPAKRANTGSASGISGQERSSIEIFDNSLLSLTLEQLNALQRGMPLAQKKEG